MGAGGLWLWSVRHQEALNRQLISALVTSDATQALVLVNEGADPNTPFEPPPPPSLRQCWDYFTHRSGWPVSHTPSAFLIACGTYPASTDSGHFDADAPELVQAMLKRGADKNAKYGTEGWEVGEGYTPLAFSIMTGKQKTIGALLDAGFDANAPLADGSTPLTVAVMVYDQSHPKASISTIRQLLMHGADPNRVDANGVTLLHLARQANALDLIALLKKAGAKE